MTLYHTYRIYVLREYLANVKNTISLYIVCVYEILLSKYTQYIYEVFICNIHEFSLPEIEVKAN